MILRIFLIFVACVSLQARVDRQMLFDHLYASSAEEDRSQVVYEVDLTNASQEASSPGAWFSQNGYESKYASKVKLAFENSGISFQTRRSTIAVWGKKQTIQGAKKVRVEWIVDKYPRRANYETGSKYASIYVNVAFGTKTFSSGIPFVPAAPYFFSLFPGEKEPLGKFYKHKYWKETSRHVCVSTGAPEGNVIVSEFELDKNFQLIFPEDSTPDISGFLIAMNSNGSSKATLRKIQFLK